MSHECGCTTPCNCVLSEDGYWAERPQDGRRNTTLAGSGTPNDPFTVSFMQSEFYRPPAGEKAGIVPITLTTGVEKIITQSESVVVYESPGHVLINFALSPNLMAAVFGNFMIAGASATFESSNTTGRRTVGISSEDPFTGITRPFAISEQGGSASRSSFVQTSGFASGRLDKTGLQSGVSSASVTAFAVSVFQDSGGPLDVTQVKFWVVVI